jgi:hypothetical protein
MKRRMFAAAVAGIATSVALMVPTAAPSLAGSLSPQVARLWGGLHYRFSSRQGVRIGRMTADWALERFFLPAG